MSAHASKGIRFVPNMPPLSSGSNLAFESRLGSALFQLSHSASFGSDSGVGAVSASLSRASRKLE